MFTKVWALDALERAARAAASAALGVLGSSVANVLDADWKNVLLTSGGAGAVSLLLSVAASGTGDRDSASLVSPPVHQVDGVAPSSSNGAAA